MFRSSVIKVTIVAFRIYVEQSSQKLILYSEKNYIKSVQKNVPNVEKQNFKKLTALLMMKDQTKF